MTTTTPYLGLTLYDSSGDQAATFATFRAVLAGTATTSNFYKIDTAMSGFNVRITALENNAGAISVPMTYISANYYEASGISGITAYNTGATIIVNLDTTSAGTVTLNINSLGTKSLMKIDTAGSPVNIAGTELKKNVRYLFVYDGTRWLWVSQKEKNDGWIDDGNTWTYSSADGATGIASVNADMTTTLQKGDRFGYNQAQALSGYWTFDTDNSASVGSFTMGNIATPTYTSGKFSNALTLNGTTQALSITDTSTLKPTGEFTLGLWFKTSNTGAIKTLFQSYSDNTNANGIKLEISAGNVITFAVGNNSASDSSSFTGTTTVTGGTFNRVVVSYRNNYLQIYLNGVLETAGYCVTPTYAVTNYIRIGCGNVTGTDINFMNGQIDDLFFINGYALDEKTIYDKYIADTAQGTASITIQKMALITNVGVWSGSATLVTFWGGADYSLSNTTMSSPKYSAIKSPFGFNTNPDKWSVLLSDATVATQSSPSVSTWYNLGSLSLSIPIGLWRAYYELAEEVVLTTVAVTTVGVRATLSTSSSSESDNGFTSVYTTVTPIVTGGILRVSYHKEKILSLSSKTTYYLLGFSGASVTSLSFSGTTIATIVKIVSAYL